MLLLYATVSRSMDGTSTPLESRAQSTETIALPKNSDHFFTPETFPRELAQKYPKVIAEVNAGNFPFGLKLSSEQPDHLVISQDIVSPSKNGLKRRLKSLDLRKGFPENFVYLTGDLTKLPIPEYDAIFSLFPSNMEETMEWLPKTIKHAFINGDPYVAIVTEIGQGKTAVGELYHLDQKLPAALSGLGQDQLMSNLSFAEVEGLFLPTEYSNYLPSKADNVLLIEINPHKRGQYLKSPSA